VGVGAQHFQREDVKYVKEKSGLSGMDLISDLYLALNLGAFVTGDLRWTLGASYHT